MQGDFIEALMDNVGNDLGKPAREISEYLLNGCLDTAVRASSAQYDSQDRLNRLRIKLENSQANDEGGFCSESSWLENAPLHYKHSSCEWCLACKLIQGAP